MGNRGAMGQRIQELRKAEGLTQEQLAQKIGVSMAAIRNYENGLSSKIVLQYRGSLMSWSACFRHSSWISIVVPRSGRCWPCQS